MGNRLVIAVLLGLLLFSAVSFGQDWQYANVFNLVEEGYGPWIPSWYTTSYGRVDSYTPSTPSLRTATMRTADGRDERPVPLNHDQTVLRFDLLSSTDDFFLKGVTVTLIGSPDFDPNEDLAPIHPDTAKTLFCVDDTVKSFYTGFQFYVEKGELAGSNVDSLDTVDIEDMPTPLQFIDDTLMAGTPPTERIYPAAQSWEDVTGTFAGTYPAGWKVWQAQINFRRHIEIRNEADIDPAYGLPFLRMWVLMKPIGCHECIPSSNDGGFIEGLSNRDSFYVQIHETNDLHVYDVLGVDDASGLEIIRDVELPIGRTEVRWDTPDPDPADASRWASSGMLIGGDTIPPFITDLIPRNENPTNGDETDQGGLTGCDEIGDEIWTADSTQPISFVAYDKSTCIDSVFVELRHINDGIPTYFPRRVDSIYFRSQLASSADIENGGAGQPWEVSVRPYGGSWSPWEEVFDVASEFEVVQSGMCADGYCGHDTFFIDVGRDIDNHYLPPFIDGAHIEVTVRAFNRNYNVGSSWAHSEPYAYDAYQDTTWDFYVDLSGPNAELVCPGTSDDNLTEEFYGGAAGWRQDYIEGENIDWRWISDSLPLVQVHLYDDYENVHDETNHGDAFPYWTGAEGGCGINERDFEFAFVVNRLVCDDISHSYITDTFVVDQTDLNQGCWFDEHVNGEEGHMWINFEDLETYRTDLTGTMLDGDPILPFRSGDVLEIHQTELFDDPDYGQGTFRYDVYGWFHTGPADLEVGGSYGIAEAPDPNYGVQNRREVQGDRHIPVDDQAAAIYGVTARRDTLGILRIDLEGPVAPDTFFYPPHGWVTSDTLQVITVDLYDQIGCPLIDQNLSDETDHILDQYVSGIYGASSDENSRLAINLVVKSASGDHHPEYVEFPGRPWEGRTWYVPGWTTNCLSQPHHIEKINERWGTRLTFAPRQHAPFRSGDKVCVTVYAWDNAVTDCDYDTMFTTDLTCADGSTWHTVENWIPGRNWADDDWTTDPLERTHDEVARFCFYVDITPPKLVDSKIYPLCDDTMTFTIRDTSEVISTTFCDEWIAGIGAADLRMWVYDDEDTMPGIHDDFLFFNDLVPAVPTGAVQVDTTHNIVGRENRYMYARMDFGADPAREGIIKVWKDCNANSCHVLEPDDSVVVEIWAGDNPNVPWYAATQRPESEAGYHARNTHSTAPTQYWWWHYYVPGFPISAGDEYWIPCPATSWRRGNHAYTDLDHTEDGLGWENHVYYNWENPNWDKIHQEEFIVQSEVWLKQVQWFNDSAWMKYRSALQYNYPPDLHGKYTTLWAIPDTTEAADFYSEMESMDPYLGTYARDLQFIEAEIYTCTDSIIWEAFWESTPHDDTITWRTPRVELKLWDSEGELVWEYVHHEDYDFIGGEHCDPCFLEYEATRDCCKDGGIMRIGPIEMIHPWLEEVRQDSVPESELHPDNEAYVITDGEGEPVTDDEGEILYTVYGYQHGDQLEVTFGFASRTPNMFTDSSDIHNYNEYHWFYDIDMQAPTARFRRLEGTRGYAEVDCEMMHVDNNEVRIRLEDIADGDVGLHPGGTDADWASTYPIPILKEGTDLVKYMWGTGDDEPAGLEYATSTHYIYQNESHVVQNCAEEDSLARAYTFATPITMYSGLEDGDPPTVLDRTIEQDSIMIADSLYVEAVIQDRLGNEQYLRSNNLGLDNGLPEVKGFAFASFDPELDEFNNWDEDFALLPWEVPDQESLVGVYNFGEVCTVFVRIWFNDNMDMRLADTHTGHIVRFQPDGWTHWFPVIPIDTELHPSLGMYPLAQRYVDYAYGDDYGAGTLLRSVDGEDGEITEAGEAEMLDNGWNSDREWIGYMVIAGDDMMDGIGKIRVQGFDDNAGNTMLARDFNFRIESQYIDPCMIWPDMDRLDTEPIDPWTGETDDELVVTGYDIGDYFCSYEPHEDCYPIVSDCFDRTITDSVVFEFWWDDSMMTVEDMYERIDTIEIDPDSTVHDTVWVDADFHHEIDDMRSEDIWTEDGEEWYAQTTCDVLDILHEWYEDGVMHDGRFDKYVTIRFRVYSRFYPEEYVESYTWNLRVDNEKTYPDLTEIGGGELPPGTAMHVIPAVTEEIKICITSDEIDQIDYINFTLTDMVTDVVYGITDTIGDPEDSFLQVGDASYEATYDPEDDVICYTWETPEGLTPGLWKFCAEGYDEIHIVTDEEDGEITGYNTYMHTFCFCRDSILVPNEAFLARGDHYEDAIATICENYPAEPNCDSIYPWDIENIYPDWPAWSHIDGSIIEGYDHVNRFQITTFNNPDWTESDVLMRDYVETGGYPGDSVFVMFRAGDALWVDMHIEDEYGGNISGSNLEIIHPLDSTDIRDYMGADYYVYPWVIDDQENRYDGPVRVTFTTYRENFAGDTIATDHVTFVYLDTYDPEYKVSMTRMDESPLRSCVSDEYPLEEAIWCTNDDTVFIKIDWYQTVFDQTEDVSGYTAYDEEFNSRVWEHLRLSIDGQPHMGFHVDDPNDLLQSRLWQRDIIGPVDGYIPFWLSPIDDGPMPWDDFGDDNYEYRWHVSDDLRGQGIADILVKGRDAAGNILTYEEARISNSYGKKVLIDVEDPTIDPELVHLTAEEMEADPEAFDDNYLGEGFEDPVSGGYVFIEIWDLDETVMLGDDIWVNDDGSVDPAIVDLISGDSVLVCAVDLAGNRTCEPVEVMPHVECCSYHLYPGFNMVGISVHPEDSTDLLVENVFPGLDVYTLDGGVYNEVPDGTYLNHSEGYLVMAEVETDIVLCGDPVESFEATGLLPGWNLIGGPWTTVRTVDAGVDPADAIDLEAVNVYDGETGSYVPTTEFAHCRGHLVMVRTTDTATVTIPDDTPGAKYVYTGKEASELWNGIIDVKYDDAMRSLTFGVASGATDGIDANDVALFPTLPGETDAYLDNHLAKSVVANDYQIEWDLVLHQDAAISPNVAGVPENWEITIDGINLRDVENLDLEAGTYKISANVAEIPTNFELAQNSPNPFNPITSINYSVPSESHVNIEIFNVLGETVTQLVDEVQDAGKRTVRWDGTDSEGNSVKSGVYFYKMTADGYSQTRKMSLVK
ncbi:MAG: FlgD immunoglobulin-like domain containing protein [Candidatus Zixiibacteriota bacterium]